MKPPKSTWRNISDLTSLDDEKEQQQQQQEKDWFYEVVMLTVDKTDLLVYQQNEI